MDYVALWKQQASAICICDVTVITIVSGNLNRREEEACYYRFCWEDLGINVELDCVNARFLRAPSDSVGVVILEWPYFLRVPARESH